MNKYLYYLIVFIFILGLSGCNKPNPDTDNPVVNNPNDDKSEPEVVEHNCNDYVSDWINVEPVVCGQNERHKVCLKCNEILLTTNYTKVHEYSEQVLIPSTCTQEGLNKYTCTDCGDNYEIPSKPLGHVNGKLVVTKIPTDDTIGSRDLYCDRCDEVIKTFTYLNNNYHFNGKLSVVGPALVNQDGEKIQLYGLSTHGIQWFGRYCNFDTLAAITSEFGINIVRFSMTTSEGGYCSGNTLVKEQMLADLHEGIDAATKLGLYVIVDWHMVGATDPADKNPLTYLEESKEFFSYISEYYKDQNNILFEIMNEPNGSTTWADCKKYANEVIPCIRKNSDGIILVGNPRWTADLNSVMKDPLVGYTNIMYTYHFYARDHRNTTQVKTAYDSGFPVFISEFGFMNSDGDGPISTTNGNAWKEVLDSRNISYVAWNISNSECSSSIFKQNSSIMDDVSDANLREWGIYLKNWYRSKSLLG